ncbi:MAG TPA: dephospho-CoA kinase [Pseudonocardiaceae bacterium]|jgi:dephospho-CoA kinase|nr:dephospho-CoA kinase [Pseudonocardiaceae bacterium]
MLRVGLTGGIGSGKSTVSGRLAEHGATIIDADRIARQVVEPGSIGLAKVTEAFGGEVLAPDGSLDRAALARVVFADDSARQRLNGIVHPLIGTRTAELTSAAPEDAVLVHDVPLLVENGLAPMYHLVIVVDAPVPERIRRLVRDRGMTEEEITARIAAQADEARRRAVADVWLDNGGSQDEVLAEVDALWADRLVPFEANIRLRRYADRGAPKIVPYHREWPAQAQRVAARIRLAAGALAQRVDHIGSTAVPGLAAKDVLDLQVAVRSMADADDLDQSLASAGFPRCAGLDADTPKPSDPDPEHRVERTHVSADPARWVNLHLRIADGPGWRYALLARDWLRADETARAEYEELKRGLAAGHHDRSITEYGRAQHGWLDAAQSRAEDWARRSGWTVPDPA